MIAKYFQAPDTGRVLRRALPAILSLGLWPLLVLPVQAGDWVNYVFVSSTWGISDSRLCAGASATDFTISCPTYAPSLSTAGDISVTGNLSADKFIGDGSALTGVNAASTDRIISGTSSVIVSDSGHISFTTAGAERMVINSSGKVGIGTTSPNGTLHVVQSAAAVAGRFDFFSSINPFSFYRGNGTPSAITKALTGDSLGGIAGFGANDATGFNSGPSARIRFLSIEDQTNSSRGADILFETVAKSGQTIAERMRLLNNGNVGIGTAAPQATLQVSGSFTVSTTGQTSSPSFYVGADGKVAQGTNSPFYNFQITNAGPYNVGVSSTTGGATLALSGNPFGQLESTRGTLLLNASQSGSNMTFRTSNTERMQITASGNVGISTTNPNAKLEVNGTISATDLRLSGNLYVSGSQTIDGVTFANGGVSATGTVTATSFSGNGSGLTGVIAASTDRITSGTSSIIVSQSGHISFTTAGSERMVINSSGDVGIGTSAPSSTLDVRGQLHVGNGTDTISGGIRFKGAAAYYDIYPFSTNTMAVSQRWKASAGSVGSPGLGFTSDVASGVYQPTSGTVGLVTAGIERIRLNSNGNVGIGTTSPNATLQVSGSFIVSNSAQTTTPTLYVGTNGRVGIGTTAPGSNLEVSASNSTASAEVKIRGVSGLAVVDRAHTLGDARLEFSTADSLNWTLGLDNNPIAATNAFTIKRINNGEPNLVVTTSGNVGISTTNPNAKLEVNGTISATDLRLSGNLYVSGSQTIDGVTFANGGVSATGIVTATSFSGDGSGLTGVTAAQTDRIVSGTSGGTGIIAVSETGYISITQSNGTNTAWFDPSLGLVTLGVSSTGGVSASAGYFRGRVGVGTTPNASYMLEIANNARINSGGNAQLVLNAASGSASSIQLTNGGGTQTITGGVGSVANLAFSIAGTERMRLNATGLGIGTTTPATALHVSSSNSSFQMKIGQGGTGYAPASILLEADTHNSRGQGLFHYNTLADTAWFSGVPYGVAGTKWMVGYASQAAFDPELAQTASALMTVDDGGNVGIGTSDPQAKLEVNGTISATDLRLSGNLYVSGSQTIDGVTFANGVSATGTVTATSFSGDGSRLSNLPTGDRIISNSTGLTANSDHYISVTTNNVVTGYFDTTGRLVTPGISVTTNQLSATTAYFSGKVGIGLSAPGQALEIVSGENIRFAGTGAVQFGGTSGQYINASGWASNGSLMINMDANGNGVATDDFRIATGISGATELMRVKSTGNVGIGTVTPTSTLQVSGTFTVSSTITNANPALYVSSSGNVGIGTSSPNGILQVSGYRSNSPIFSNIWLDLGNTGGHAQGMITLNANGGSGVAGIGLQSVDANNGDLTFATRHASTWAEKIRIKSTGSVGIGTTNPSQTLHIAGTALTTSWTYINANVASRVTPTTPLEVSGTISATAFVGDGSGLTGITTTSDRITSGTSSVIVSDSGHISFTTAGTERMVINSSGNVGIGTSAPAYTLDISGTLRANTITADVGSGSNNAVINLTGRNAGASRNAIVMSNYLGGIVLTPYSGMPVSVGLNSSSGANFQVNGNAVIGFNAANTTGPTNGLAVSGNVGIGTTAPTSALQVSGTFTVSSTITNANPALYVSSTGNVGIGTSTPAVALDIQMRNASEGLRIRRHNSSGQYLDIHEGTGNGHFIDAVGTGTKWVMFRNYDSHPGGGYAFYVSNATVLGLAVATSGNVGIGTTSPAKTLDVSGTARITSDTIVSGTIKLAGTGDETCNTASIGTIRVNPTSGKLELCRQ